MLLKQSNASAGRNKRAQNPSEKFKQKFKSNNKCRSRLALRGIYYFAHSQRGVKKGAKADLDDLLFLIA
jgi:hypothetical protein